MKGCVLCPNIGKSIKNVKILIQVQKGKLYKKSGICKTSEKYISFGI